jgi:hypothetical protein
MSDALFPSISSNEWRESLALARRRQSPEARAERRRLWSVTFDALSKSPDLRAEFAAGVRSEIEQLSRMR